MTHECVYIFNYLFNFISYTNTEKGETQEFQFTLYIVYNYTHLLDKYIIINKIL